jgi:hypothetical protein
MGEAAAVLKMTERQVYELTRRRSLERMEHPFPVFDIHAKAKRIRRSDLTAWIDTLAMQGRRGNRQANSGPRKGERLLRSVL